MFPLPEGLFIEVTVKLKEIPQSVPRGHEAMKQALEDSEKKAKWIGDITIHDLHESGNHSYNVGIRDEIEGYRHGKIDLCHCMCQKSFWKLISKAIEDFEMVPGHITAAPKEYLSTA